MMGAGQHKPNAQEAPSLPPSALEGFEQSGCRTLRYGLLAFGFLNVGLGIVGAFLPVMPTTVFLLIALWAFSKSSLRFHLWLYNHPVLGTTLRNWHQHRVIPLNAKIMAWSMMTASLVYVTLFQAEGWGLPLGLFLLFAAVSGYIAAHPHRPAEPQNIS